MLDGAQNDTIGFPDGLINYDQSCSYCQDEREEQTKMLAGSLAISQVFFNGTKEIRRVIKLLGHFCAGDDKEIVIVAAGAQIVQFRNG